MFGAFLNMSPPFEMNQSFVAAAMASSNDESLQQLGMPISPRKFGPRKLCRICAEEATSNHFGALSCHACAAFFRRTVAFRRTYTCRHQQNCKLINVSPRRMCKYCRLAKCLAIGMQPSEVRSNGSGAGNNSNNNISNNSFLNNQNNNSNLSRNDAESPGHSDQPSSSSSNAQSPNINNADGLNQINQQKDITSKLINFANLNLSSTSNNSTTATVLNNDQLSILHAIILESAVCTAFINSSGLIDYLSGKEKNLLLDQGVTQWINMDLIKFLPNNNEQKYIINQQFIDTHLQYLEKLYGINKNITNSQILNKIIKLFYDKINDLSKLIEKNQLDEYEYVALTQLTLIRISYESSVNVTETQMKLAPYVSVLTKDIQNYYNNKYQNIETATLKFNKLVLLVGELYELRQLYNKNIITLYMKEFKDETTSMNRNNNAALPMPIPISINSTTSSPTSLINSSMLPGTSTTTLPFTNDLINLSQKIPNISTPISTISTELINMLMKSTTNTVSNINLPQLAINSLIPQTEAIITPQVSLENNILASLSPPQLSPTGLLTSIPNFTSAPATTLTSVTTTFQPTTF